MKNWIFVGILILAIFLRLYKLAAVPPSPSLDEVSIGYNAYSILKTGKDEYGISFPILLRAYDDWRPALYVYFVIPFVKLFGVGTISVRLPSIILSIITVIITYALSLKILKKEAFALAVMFFLTISPWHIYISRLGHEVNLGLFAGVAATYFFLKNSFVLSSLFFVLSLYSYQSQKIIVPVIVFGLFLIYRKEFWQARKTIILCGIFAAILIFPIVQASFSPQAMIRFRETSAFHRNQPIVYKSNESFVQAKQSGDFLGQILSHRLIVAAKITWANYISNFGPKWIFSGSLREAHKAPNLGLLYWWELPLILFGLFQLNTLSKQSIRLILLWIFVSPLPSAITTQAPHAMRSFTMLPYLQIIGAIGFISFWNAFKRYRMISVIIICLSVLFFAKNYYVIFPKTQSDSFQYALTQSIPYVVFNEQRYSRIVFSNQNNLYQSYMFFLFHSMYDPIKYAREGGTISGGFSQAHKIGKFEFRPIDWNADSSLKNTLFIGNPNDFPHGVAPIHQFAYLDGKIGVVAVSP